MISVTSLSLDNPERGDLSQPHQPLPLTSLISTSSKHSSLSLNPKNTALTSKITMSRKHTHDVLLPTSQPSPPSRTLTTSFSNSPPRTPRGESWALDVIALQHRSSSEVEVGRVDKYPELRTVDWLLDRGPWAGLTSTMQSIMDRTISGALFEMTSASDAIRIEHFEFTQNNIPDLKNEKQTI